MARALTVAWVIWLVVSAPVYGQTPVEIRQGTAFVQWQAGPPDDDPTTNDTPTHFLLFIDDPSAERGPCSPDGPCYDVGLPLLPDGVTYEHQLPALSPGLHTISIRAANPAGLSDGVDVPVVKFEVFVIPSAPTNVVIEVRP